MVTRPPTRPVLLVPATLMALASMPDRLHGQAIDPHPHFLGPISTPVETKRHGDLADLIVVDGNPAETFRHMYSFGAIRMADDGSMVRSRGIVHTIKDGVVTENANLMREVERMVAESREGAEPLPTQIPCIP
jgi:hypothetical protein